MNHPPIYLDNHATTRVDPRVVDAMLPYFTDTFGNPGSTSHGYGEAAHDAVEQGRASIASAIRADPREIIFTSGATESNNLALRGVAQRRRRRGNHLISVETEHSSVLEPLKHLSQHDYEITLLQVEPFSSPHAGWLDPQKVDDAIRDDTVLVSVMLANNEIGVIQSLAEIASICHRHGVLLHCDAAQAIGKISVNIDQLQVDLLSFTAHKIYGPKGIGALYVRRRDPMVRLEPQILGGGQQHGLRSGTLNTPGIVGFAKALELCLTELPTEAQRQTALRSRLWNGLCDRLGKLQLCGPAFDEHDTLGQPLRLSGNLNFALGDVDGEAILLAIKNIAISSGATCASTDPGPSHVLLALGMTNDLARSSLRIGLGRFNTETEVDLAIEAITQSVENLRKMGSS